MIINGHEDKIDVEEKEGIMQVQVKQTHAIGRKNNNGIYLLGLDSQYTHY